MADGEDSSAEKSEEPTSKRLEKAREDGEVCRSKELNTLVVLLAGATAMLMFGNTMAVYLSDMMQYNFSVEREVLLDEEMLLQHFSTSAMQGLKALLPLFAVLFLASILGPIALGGWNFSTKSLAPKFSRMDPIAGLKRMFGAKALMELFKAIGKVLVVASVAVLVLATQTETILGILKEPLFPAIAHSVNIIAWAAIALASALIFIAAVDIPFQMHEHSEKLKMTLQQVKDEMKDTEGRPEVKQKIRQLQQQMAQNRMMGDVPDADVVITNPTHYSVALSYDQDKESAPILLAKGGDYIALKIRELAKENKVPIVESAELARSIYFNTEIGDEIPAGLYLAVAQVLAYIYQLQEYAKGLIKKPYLNKKLEVPEELQHN